MIKYIQAGLARGSLCHSLVSAKRHQTHCWTEVISPSSFFITIMMTILMVIMMTENDYHRYYENDGNLDLALMLITMTVFFNTGPVLPPLPVQLFHSPESGGS